MSIREKLNEVELLVPKERKLNARIPWKILLIMDLFIKENPNKSNPKLSEEFYELTGNYISRQTISRIKLRHDLKYEYIDIIKEFINDDEIFELSYLEIEKKVKNIIYEKDIKIANPPISENLFSKYPGLKEELSDEDFEILSYKYSNLPAAIGIKISFLLNKYNISINDGTKIFNISKSSIGRLKSKNGSGFYSELDKYIDFFKSDLENKISFFELNKKYWKIFKLPTLKKKAVQAYVRNKDKLKALALHENNYENAKEFLIQYLKEVFNNNYLENKEIKKNKRKTYKTKADKVQDYINQNKPKKLKKEKVKILIKPSSKNKDLIKLYENFSGKRFESKNPIAKTDNLIDTLIKESEELKLEEA